MAGSLDPINVGPAEPRSITLQMLNRGDNDVLIKDR